MKLKKIKLRDKEVGLVEKIEDNSLICDTPHCGNKPEVFVKFCKSCAQDKRLG